MADSKSSARVGGIRRVKTIFENPHQNRIVELMNKTT